MQFSDVPQRAQVPVCMGERSYKVMVAHTGKVKFPLQEPVFLSNWSRQGKNERPSTSLNNGLQICMSLERTPSPCSRATSLVDCRAHGIWLAQASAT